MSQVRQEERNHEPFGQVRFYFKGVAVVGAGAGGGNAAAAGVVDVVGVVGVAGVAGAGGAVIVVVTIELHRMAVGWKNFHRDKGLRKTK